MSHFQPLVSIVIPVYNGSNFLAQAIESALAQSYPNIEVIVVNDGSNDNGASEKAAQAFGDKIRYVSKANGGVASALNHGIACSQGEYISWLSHDDLYERSKVEVQILQLEKLQSPDVILYSDYSVFSTDSTNSTDIELENVPPESFRYWITQVSALHGCTLLIPKRAFEVCGSFDSRLKHTQDYDLWFRMSRSFRFIRTAGVLVKSRQHGEQDSVAKAPAALIECNQLVKKCILELTKDQVTSGAGLPLAAAYASIAFAQSRRGFRKAGLFAFQKSIVALAQSDAREILAWFVVVTKGARLSFAIRGLVDLLPVRTKAFLKHWLKRNSKLVPR